MKTYAGERAIISLTSWRARINTVGKTIYSLIKNCPGFHIVLVLSLEEFPKRENNLPRSLNLMADNNLIEILWTPGNIKSCKKLLFTMKKYPEVPVISADDDCLYTCNYAEELYNAMTRNNYQVVRYNMYNRKDSWQYTQGPSTIFNPSVYKYIFSNEKLFFIPENATKDDTVITNILKKNNIKIYHIYRGNKFCFVFHDELSPIHRYSKCGDFRTCYDTNK